MAEDSQNVVVLERLQALGVVSLSEWDALSFLYRHATSLSTAAQIARLIGYDKAEIGAALNRLEALGLLKRSRISQGIRIYQFSEPLEPSRRSYLVELMSFARSRAGRLLLVKHLKSLRHEPRRGLERGLRLT